MDNPEANQSTSPEEDRASIAMYRLAVVALVIGGIFTLAWAAGLGWAAGKLLNVW
jgi:hypothetical protein